MSARREAARLWVVWALGLLLLLPPPATGASAQQEPVADDRQHLSDQGIDVQSLFVSVYGPAAADEWVAQRNAQLAREAVPQPVLQNPAMPRPELSITQPTAGQSVPTVGDFTLRGTVTDPTAGPKAIDRVEAWLDGRRNTQGSILVGVARLDGDGGWSLNFSPTKFPSINSNLYVYGHSRVSGNTAVAIVNFTIADPH